MARPAECHSVLGQHLVQGLDPGHQAEAVHAHAHLVKGRGQGGQANRKRLVVSVAEFLRQYRGPFLCEFARGDACAFQSPHMATSRCAREAPATTAVWGEAEDRADLDHFFVIRSAV